ncbi:hypothetical protein C5S30_04130, partial [ANME-1 cluster archaeon GoMg4]|nr:hypothetical protein [ANME-1 cluster archaeon GoMg4]
RVKKMEETARGYIAKYGLPAVEEDISSILAESKKERKRIVESINQSLSELEESLKGEEAVKEGGMRLEGILRRFEREVVEKGKGKEALSSKLEEFEGDKEEVWGRYENLKNAWNESIAEIERRKKTLDVREIRAPGRYARNEGIH